MDNFLLYNKDNFLNESELVSSYNINNDDILTIREGFKINIQAKIGKSEKIENNSEPKIAESFADASGNLNNEKNPFINANMKIEEEDSSSNISKIN